MRLEWRGRRGQMETGELLMVVIVVVILLVLGALFAVKLSGRSLDKLGQAYIDVESVKVAKRASAFPQVACDEGEKTRQGCVDRLKLAAFNEALLVDDRTADYAFNSFGASTISLVILSGDRAGERLNLYSYPYEGYDRGVSFYPVLVYDPIGDEYAFGYWNITIYTRARS